MNTPLCIWDAQAALGEGPLWSAKEQALYWVDILNHRLHRYGPQQQKSTWQFDEEISAVAERADHVGLIVTLRHGFAYFDPATEKLERLLDVEAELPSNRFNDGKCDSAGRFWAGTMDFGCRQPTGSLYRLSPDLGIKKIDSGYPITNGPAWSLDQKIMYYNDTANRRTYAFDFDVDSGEATGKRVFLEYSADEGTPDGMTTDAEGGLWIAHWGVGSLTRRDAIGQVLQTVELPCSQITSCAFGGPDLTTLFITSAATGMSGQQLQREPLAGSLFAIEMEIPGMPAGVFRA